MAFTKPRMYRHMDFAGYHKGQITLSYLLSHGEAVVGVTGWRLCKSSLKTYMHSHKGHSVIVTQRNTCTPPHLSLAVKGHTPPCDSCQSQEVGIMRSIKNTPKGCGRPWGIEICCMSPLDVTCRKSAALITQERNKHREISPSLGCKTP